MQSFLQRAVVLSAASCATAGTFVTQASGQVGTCETPVAEAYLDVGNVRARILNNGNLFWRSDPYVYEVPKGGGVMSVFMGGFYVGGRVNNELRVAAARYGRFEFWSGPIDDVGNPPANCADYDWIWSIYRSDLERYEAGEPPTSDLLEWPTGLGAPTIAPAGDDGVDNDDDGVVDEAGEVKRVHDELLELPLTDRVDRTIDLEAGERPEMIGDQMLWWIMNDNGNLHEETGSEPIGIEVHVTAFAFAIPGDVGNTTFYRNRIFLRSGEPLESAYVGLFADIDLGDFQDDYVGSDTTLGMGFVYNADNDDRDGYGKAPPAIGYDFLQGPIVTSPGDTAVVAGRPVADMRRLDMSAMVYYNGGGGVNEEPLEASDYYMYMQGRWKDGRPILEGSDGFNYNDEDPNRPAAPMMYPGDPVTRSYWSELNYDDQGSVHTAADRRFIAGAGPFRMAPGDVQEIVYGIIWARGDDHLDSVTRLRVASRRAQRLADGGFRTIEGPDAPQITLTPRDHGADIAWSNPVGSNNFLDGYRVWDPFADPDDPYTTFEGYEVWRFNGEADTTGTLMATYDVPNDILEVIDDVDGDEYADRHVYGTDSGVRHAHAVDGLDNYRSYHFGVRTYAVSKGSAPSIRFSEIVRSVVIPAPASATLDDIGIVPNPYRAISEYEVDLSRDEVRFTGLPDVATIRVFTLHGTLVRTLAKDSPGLRSLSWDVRNEDGRKLASGMYLIHVEVPGVGERVIKFGMVKDGVVE